jgi:D-arabinose 1-dehydrogenase-like Zn-dependent alcohol dehydrogenase
MSVKEIPEPEIGPHDVLVKVAAAGVCYHDILAARGVLRRGLSPNVVLGHEISGYVEAIGNLVTKFTLGQKVASILTEACGLCDRCRSGREHRCRNGRGIGHSINGGFAEYTKIKETSLTLVPEGIEMTEAALLACPIGVGVQAMLEVAKLEMGETVLVTGAGGGLGTHMVQIGKAVGARVMAVTSSPEKITRLEDLGADDVLLMEDVDFSEIARALTEDEGVDVVVDCVGPSVFQSCVTSLTQFGRMVILGDVTGGEVVIRPAEILFRDAQISGSSGTSIKNLERAASLVASGTVNPVISEELSLHEWDKAYEQMINKESFGRICLLP